MVLADYALTTTTNKCSLCIVGCSRQSDVDRDRWNGFGKDDTDYAVSCWGGLHGERQDRLHSTTSCCCHVCRQTSFWGIWLPTWPGGVLV